MVPERENPAPVMVAALTVTAEVPVEVRVTDFVIAVPTEESPKLRLLVLKLNTGLVEVPEPLRLTVAVLPVLELLEMVIEPLAAPATVGMKLTRRLTVVPGFSVTGNVAPVMVKPVPDNAAELTVTAAVPDEVRVRVCVEVVLSVTLPKARLPELTLN